MPFKSEQQRKFLHANHPEIAQRWEHKYGSDPKQGKNDAISRRLENLKKKKKGGKK